jgi:iron complex outermembrane recepter protein
VQTPIAASVAAVSVVTADRIASLPNATLADALRLVPGFALLDLHGLGYDPQITVRGFYGGGEAEYVVVLVDGKPINDVQSGRIAWDAIPLTAVGRIEVVRGGSSALWGDAAIGGVINVVTKSEAGSGSDSGVAWRSAVGSYGTWRGSADGHGRVGARSASLSAGADRTAGFRAHSERTTARAAGRLTLASAPDRSLTASLLTHTRNFDEPGPLLDRDVAADRAASDVFYRFDRTADQSYRLGLDGDQRLGRRTLLSGSVLGDMRRVETVRTLGLSPDFADTQERVLATGRALGSVQVAVDRTGLSIPDRLVVGIDASHGSADSKYYRVVTGDRDAYSVSTGARTDLDTSGNGERTAAAAFMQYTLLPAEAVRLSAGVRADWLRDSFSPRLPADAVATTARHSAVSPRIGVNVQYLRSLQHTGNMYLTAGRSFKAPTLDQLFDQRRIPVPFPPFSVNVSNALLDPQHGENVEAGVFHTTSFIPGVLTAELSLALYQMDMKDELDFDLQTFRYVNIGRSRHRGVEAGFRLAAARAGSAFLNYTQQSATLRAGDNTGSQVKAIPLHSLSAGLDAPVGRLGTGVVVSHARDIFLDDANTMKLPPYTRVDASISYPAASVRLFLDVRNLFGARFSTTGYPDPAGSDAVFYHPAAGRTFELGLRGSH